MKKMFIFLFIFIFHKNINLEAKDLVILGLPRSGTGYIQKMVSKSTGWDYQDSRDVWSVNKENQRVCGEIFGNWFKFFEYEGRNIFDEPSEQEFNDIYFNKWKRIGRLKFSKEITMFLYVPYFEKYFNIICLLRERKHTFPTSLPWVFDALYSNFITCKNNDEKIILLKKYCLDKNLNNAQKKVFVHIISYYFLLRDIEKYDLPILKWDRVMRLSGRKLDDYLRQIFPLEYVNSLAEQIEKTRMNRFGHIIKCGKWFPVKYYFNYWIYGKDLVDIREEKYQKLDVEKDCQNLLNYIQKIDPQFTYIKYLR